MVTLAALWMPIVVSAVFVFIASAVLHSIPVWHKKDMTALPDEDSIMDAMRNAGVQPGEYRFPYGATVADMETPAFQQKMKLGPVGNVTIRPSGETGMGKLLGQYFVYALVISLFSGYLTAATHSSDAPYLEVFRVSGTVAFCCHAVAHWQNWIWWGRGTRITIMSTIDGLIFALLTGGTFGWLWPR